MNSKKALELMRFLINILPTPERLKVKAAHDQIKEKYANDRNFKTAVDLFISEELVRVQEKHKPEEIPSDSSFDELLKGLKE